MTRLKGVPRVSHRFQRRMTDTGSRAKLFGPNPAQISGPCPILAPPPAGIRVHGLDQNCTVWVDWATPTSERRMCVVEVTEVLWYFIAGIWGQLLADRNLQPQSHRSGDSLVGAGEGETGPLAG